MLLISFWWDITLCLIVIFCGFYFWISERHKYWSRKGVVSLHPEFFFGNVKDIALMRKHIGELFANIYAANKNHPYIGAYMMTRPVLVVNDLDFIKRILTRDFSNFSSHGFPVNEEKEPLAGHLFNADGTKWKYLRAKLTPTFTSNKMKMMFNVVNDCSKELGAYLERRSTRDKFVDVKDALATFSNDVIANCAFGIECNTFMNPDDKFRKMGKRISNPTIGERLSPMIDFFFPGVFSAFKRFFVNKELENFFYGLVEETVNYREKNGIVRNDFMQLLIQLKNTGKVTDDDEKMEDEANDGTRLTMMQLAAQSFLFFIAGFDTSSSAGSLALYELALNPDIQEILTDEIDSVLEKHNGNITYDSLTEMTYLTKVIEETMRKYPALPVHFRQCTKNYIIPETDIEIEKGTMVLMPIFGIHRDPDLYPNPDKFDPERFSPENRNSRHHFSYLPFGEGPRICIGARFGMMQTKLGLVAVLSKFNVTVCEKTSIPIKIDKRTLILSNDGGLWLNIKPRNRK